MESFGLILFVLTVCLPAGSIVGGRRAAPNELPYQVRLEYEGFHVCGGSIINAHTVLTAAHCVIHRKIKRFKVIAGDRSRLIHEGTEQIRKVARIFSHEGYSDSTFENDIAVLILSNSLNFNLHVQPIGVLETPVDYTGKGIISGWGKRRYWGEIPQRLHAIEVNVINWDACRETYSKVEWNITHQMICARTTGINVCQVKGYSGGPLTCNIGSNRKKTLCGILSHGYDCTEPEFPGVYMDVSKYSEWINQTIAKYLNRDQLINETAKHELTCATLYSLPELRGVKISLQSGSHLINLKVQPGTQNNVWRVTGSASVETGCTLTACNARNFQGACVEFKDSFNSPPEGFGNILSANCSCPKTCQCEDVNNIRGNSCARMYLYEGGCKSCEPYYTEIKAGESQHIPEEFQTSVSSLMVRPGCQLTVSDKPGMQGAYYSATGITQSYSRPVRSYECTCLYNSSPSTTHRPIGPSNYPPLIKIPNAFEEILEMKRTNRTHPGLTAALKSHIGKRSAKNAYILLLGTTGSGKSSTINFLFDNPNVTGTGSNESGTKRIREFRIPVPVDELGIQNSELRVIDTPGFGDTEGITKDAEILASLEEFLDSHEELKNRIPNVVLVFHKFCDNRYANPNSAFVKTIRALDSLMGRITDKKYSNVIFLFTHFMSETKVITSNPQPKLMSFKEVIQEYSRLPRPTFLVLAENKPYHYGLPMLNGSYQLPNGDLYPQNLLDQITQVTSGGKDAIGEAVIRSAFKNPEVFNVSLYDYTVPRNDRTKMSNYTNILMATEPHADRTELYEKLKVAETSMSPELQHRFPDALYYIQRAFHLYNFRTEADLPKTTPGIIKFFSKLPQNDAVAYLLKRAFEISLPAIKQVVTGFSYDILRDRTLPVSPFQLDPFQNSDITYKLPSLITCKLGFESTELLNRFFQNRTHYLDERLRDLQIEGTVLPENFKGRIKPGYNILEDFPNGNLKALITAVREFRTFELILNDKLLLTPEFKEVVTSLPPFNSSHLQSVCQWEEFFNKYGTHVVKSVYGGGSIEINLGTNDNPNFEMFHTFRQLTEDHLTQQLYETAFNSTTVQYSLTYKGGDQTYFIPANTKLSFKDASILVEKWKESLTSNPAILTKDLKLVPLSAIVKHLGGNIFKEIDRVTQILFTSKFPACPRPAHFA